MKLKIAISLSRLINKNKKSGIVKGFYVLMDTTMLCTGLKGVSYVWDRVIESKSKSAFKEKYSSERVTPGCPYVKTIGSALCIMTERRLNTEDFKDIMEYAKQVNKRKFARLIAKNR